MTILIDTREGFKDKISKKLNDLKTDNKIMKLDVGDYTTTLASVGIERKTFNDFITSSNRITRQLTDLRRNYNVAILLIEGSPVYNVHNGKLMNYAKPNFTQLNQSLKFYHASLLHYVINGIIVLHTKNIDETCWFLKHTEEYFERSVHHPLEMDLHNDKSRIISIYAMLPGIDAVLAKRLFEKFPTLSDLSNITINQFKQIDGIGEKKAYAIVRFINGATQNQQ